MKKWYLTALIVAIVLSLLTVLFIGSISGFPWERREASKAIKEYVKTEYNLTVTDVDVGFSVDGMNYCRVFTEEHDFSFEVMIRRNSYTIWGDWYLNRLVEHTLESFMERKINLTDKLEDVRVVLENKFSKDYPLTVNDVYSNPEIVLELSEITYFCSIDAESLVSERTYTIFKAVVESFNPTSIYFHFQDKSSICINSDNYSKILNAKDLIVFAE